MRKKIFLKLISFLAFMFFINSSFLFSQELNEPVLKWETNSICAKEGGANEFFVKISFSGTPFSDANNIFYIELSDEDGSFSDPSKNKILRTLPGSQNPPDVNGARNIAYNFEESFSLTDGVFGEAYKIRIRTTSPEKIYESKPFGAYYLPNVQLILNDYEDFVLCGAINQEITVKFDRDDVDISKYPLQWKKNGAAYVVSGQSINITEPGEYRASIYVNSSCNVSESNEIKAASFTNGTLNISSVAEVSLCGDETYEFVASVDDNTYEYIWYKDDVVITGLNTYQPTYTTPQSNQFGEYKLKIKTANGCIGESEIVKVVSPNDNDFNLKIEGDTTRLIFPAETMELKVIHNAVDSEIKWFVNDVFMQGVSGDTFNVTSSGVYSAQVIDKSGQCPIFKETEKFTILEVNDLNVTISSDSDYSDCEASVVKLSVVDVKAVASNGEEYVLSDDQISQIQYKWYKDDNILLNEVGSDLEIDTYTENGAYHLNASGSGFDSNSDKINVLLSVEGFEVESSSVSNSLCVGQSLFLSFDMMPGFTYQWLKEGDVFNVEDVSKIEITEVGNYELTYSGFGCDKTIAVEVTEFDSSTVTITPSSKVVLTEGGSSVVEASGADSYEWFDNENNVVATGNTFEANELGTYKLVAKLGECAIEKEIEIIEDDGNTIIPNIISPFTADGVNDTWELPNRFAFKPTTRVVIYNTKGYEVLNTEDYQNNWPENSNKVTELFYYYRIFDQKKIIKSGTISILE